MRVEQHKVRDPIATVGVAAVRAGFRGGWMEGTGAPQKGAELA